MADDNLQPEPAFPPTGEGALPPHDQVLAAIAAPSRRGAPRRRSGAPGSPTTRIALLGPEDVLRHEREQAASPIARMLAALRDTVSEDGRHAQAYLSEARLGHWILGVHTPDRDQVQRARDALAAHHGSRSSASGVGPWSICPASARSAERARLPTRRRPRASPPPPRARFALPNRSPHAR